MKDIHGEHTGHRQQVNDMADYHSNTQANKNRAALCNRLLGAHFLSGISWGQQAGDDGKGLGI